MSATSRSMPWFMLCVLLLSSFMLPGILPVMLHVLILLECVRRTMKADTDQGNMSHASWQMRSQNHASRHGLLLPSCFPPGFHLGSLWFHVGSLLVPCWFPHGSLLVPSGFPLGAFLVPAWFLLGSFLVPSWFPSWFLVGFLLVSP